MIGQAAGCSIGPLQDFIAVLASSSCGGNFLPVFPDLGPVCSEHGFTKNTPNFKRETTLLLLNNFIVGRNISHL